MPYNLLYQNISKHVLLTPKEFESISSYFDHIKVKKKEFLLREGEICKYEGFVIDGCFKIFSLDYEGNEHILYFAIKDWWLSDIDSFSNQKPAELSIQALENSEVLILSKENKEILYRDFAKFEKLFRIMTQKRLVTFQRRLINNQSKTADIRYQEFLEKYADITPKLTNRQIASYLGISHEFLSKIRRKLTHRT